MSDEMYYREKDNPKNKKFPSFSPPVETADRTANRKSRPYPTFHAEYDVFSCAQRLGPQTYSGYETSGFLLTRPRRRKAFSWRRGLTPPAEPCMLNIDRRTI